MLSCFRAIILIRSVVHLESNCSHLFIDSAASTPDQALWTFISTTTTPPPPPPPPRLRAVLVVVSAYADEKVIIVIKSCEAQRGAARRGATHTRALTCEWRIELTLNHFRAVPIRYFMDSCSLQSAGRWVRTALSGFHATRIIPSRIIKVFLRSRIFV